MDEFSLIAIFVGIVLAFVAVVLLRLVIRLAFVVGCVILITYGFSSAHWLKTQAMTGLSHSAASLRGAIHCEKIQDPAWRDYCEKLVHGDMGKSRFPVDIGR